MNAPQNPAATPRMIPLRRRQVGRSASCFAAALLALAYCLPGQSAFAGSATWNGTTSNVWSTAGNWTAGGPPGTGDTATFNNAGNSNTTISLNGITVNTILFDTSSAAAYTMGSGAVGSQTLTLNLNGAITVNSTVTNSQLFNANLTLGTDGTTAGSFTFTNNSTTGGQLLTIAGNVSQKTANNNNPARTLNLAGSGNGLISGIINGNGATNGANAQPLVSVSKSGSGTWTLSGANTYQGTTTISGGTLQLGNGGTTGSLATQSVITDNGNFTINRSNAVLQGTDFSGSAISGTGSFTQAGSGTTTLTAANTYTGATTISAGTLQLGNGGSTGSLSTSSTITDNGNFTINRSSSVTQGTDFSGSAITGTGSFTQAGSGTTTLNAANTYGGDTTISAGTLNLGASEVIPNGVGKGNVIISSGATLFLNGGFNETINGLSGSGSIFVDNGPSGTTLTVGDNNATSTFSGVISEGGNNNPKLALTKIGTGTLTLSGANSYTGLTTVSAGVLNIQNNTALGTTAAGTIVSSGATLQLQNSITVGAEALTLNGGAASGQNGDLVNVSGTNNYGGVITLATAASTISSDAGTLNLTGNISNSTFGLTLTGASSGSVSGVIGSGSGTLTKTGAGTWTLSGSSSNTYTGLTTVSAGELDLGKTGTANAIGSGGLTINGGTVKYTGTSTDEIANTANVTISGGTLDLNNHADTISSLTFNSGTLTSTGGTQTLTLAGSAATTLQMQGAATIPTSVNIAFSSTTTSGVGMTFDATNNGTATINGNINLNTTATTGVSRTFTINNGSAATDTTISGVISNTTSTGLTKAGAGTLVLSGANTYGGATTVNAGSLLVYNTTGSGTGTGSITVNNSGTIFGGGTTTGAGGVSGSVTVGAGANIAPSNSSGATGILSTGALTLASTSNFLVDINGTAVGTGFDQLKVTGGASIAGSNLLVSVGATFTQSDVGDKFAILSNVSAGLVSGTFSGLSEGASFNSGSDRFMITYVGNAGDGTNGNDIVLTLTAVPEPSTWIAGCLTLAMLLCTQRRRLSRTIKRVT
jgi:fibronectin-binding autotransporter adhesin